jgi:two-component system, sensor histidine kinase
MPGFDRATPSAEEAGPLAEEQARLAVAQGRRGRLPQVFVDVLMVGLVLSLGAGQVLWFYLPWQLLFVHGRNLWLDRLTRQGRLSLATQHQWLARGGILMAIGFIGLLIGAFQQPLAAQHFLITMCMFGVVSGGVAAAAGDVRGYVIVVASMAAGNALCWLLWGGPLGWLPALAMGVLVATLSDQVRNQRNAMLRQLRLRLQLDDALQARTRFFAAASHDLRQPLTALGYNVATLETLAQQREDEGLTQLAQGQRRSLAATQALLESLLEVSQLDAGAVQPQPQAVDLVPLVDSLLALLRPEAAQRGLAVRFEVPDAAPWTVWSDPALLRRVLQNLLGNALKFTRQGEVVVRLARQGGEVLLSVCDTGPGIARELQERVFEEFFQAGNPGRNRSLGLGLGLSIVRRLVGLLGHRLSLDSAPGRGSRFTLHLAAHEAAPTPAAKPAALSAELPAGRLRALVVDDELPIRDALAQLLRTLGWQVRCASSGAEALQQLHDGWQPEALLLDFRLGEGASGLDVLALLRAKGCTAPAWLITGDTSPERIQQAREAGLPVRYKPVDGLQLAREVHAALRSNGPPAH